MKKILRIFMVIVGLGLVLYPWLSNFLHEKNAGSQVNAYEKVTENLSDDEYKKILKQAQLYNQSLAESHVVLTDPFTQKLKNYSTDLSYTKILSLDESGIMGYVEIPCISVRLPIFHGTSGSVLEKGIGHLEGTSFPVGGDNTHAVLTGHTGLSSAKLFTDLKELEKNDLFFIHVLGENLAYKVNEINIVRPGDTRKLAIVSGKDMVTLVTCTPYGINSHRLLVCGTRTKYSKKEYDKSFENPHNDSEWMKAYKQAIVIGTIIALQLFFAIKIVHKFRKSL
ncbi:MAG: class C sortase [Lachnospiraceae bacterium]